MHVLHAVTSGWKQLGRNIRLFFLANLLYQIGTGMFSVLYNLYIQSLGYQDTMNGTIVSVQSLATALIFIPIGLIADRVSHRLLLLFGALLTGLSFMGRAFASGESGLIILSIAAGLFAAFFQVIAVPFLAENTTKQQRLKMFSYHFSLVLAAQVLGSSGGGFLADLLQQAGWSKIHSLQAVLFAGGAASVLAFIPLLFVKKTVKDKVLIEAVVPEEPVKLPAQAKDDWKAILKFTLAQLIVGTGSGLVVPYLNLYFTNRFAVSLTAVGILISLGQVMTIVSMLIGPTLASRVGPVKAVVLFQMMSLPFLLLTGFTNLFVMASISFLFRQALMNAANPIQSSIMVDRVSDARRGIANSMTQTAFMMGWATMGPVQSLLLTTYGTYWGYAITFSMTGVLYISASAIYYFMFKERRTAAAETAVSM
ncbi:MFS transporter [Paenibacillus dokdonensis]|uniref:MFS transporter n=1 Tax=Paenibacillus dokdonensis TaxID=2567944 RepID=A0ABU6GKT3_9BACL|nr:MFS transporter [Paenibacillus dokdonensis]MEC0240318.1 MFS transporter [Paenibacillus dokdonensis]